MAKDQDTVQVAHKYTVRPSEVLAVKWDGTVDHAAIISRWADGPVRMAYINRNGVLTVEPGNTRALVVQSPRGEVVVQEGGYVIRNEHGSIFGDSAQRFEAEYEQAEPEQTG